jgi:hypothetical protein
VSGRRQDEKSRAGQVALIVEGDQLLSLRLITRCQYTPVAGRHLLGAQGLVMHLRLWPLVPVGVLALLAVPAAASASIGIGIQAGPVQLSGSAHPGGSYELTPVYVVNTGTEPESVTIRVERISPGHGFTVPPSWIHATGPVVTLSHNQSARIPLVLAVPDTAKPGRYFSDVVAKGSGGISAGRANLAVAAATNMEFTVAPGVVSGTWLSLPGWLLPGVTGLLVLAVALFVVRNSGLRLRVDRRPASRSAEGQ